MKATPSGELRVQVSIQIKSIFLYSLHQSALSWPEKSETLVEVHVIFISKLFYSRYHADSYLRSTHQFMKLYPENGFKTLYLLAELGFCKANRNFSEINKIIEKRTCLSFSSTTIQIYDITFTYICIPEILCVSKLVLKKQNISATIINQTHLHVDRVPGIVLAEQCNFSLRYYCWCQQTLKWEDGSGKSGAVHSITQIQTSCKRDSTTIINSVQVKFDLL